jgi:hypothetical protein
MDDGRIPKDILFGELATGTLQTGRPGQRYKDVCKRDLSHATSTQQISKQQLPTALDGLKMS